MGEFSASALRLSLTAQLQPAAMLLLFPALLFWPVVVAAVSFLFFCPMRQLRALPPSNSLLPNFFSLRLFFSPPPLSLDASLLPVFSWTFFRNWVSFFSWFVWARLFSFLSIFLTSALFKGNLPGSHFVRQRSLLCSIRRKSNLVCVCVFFFCLLCFLRRYADCVLQICIRVPFFFVEDWSLLQSTVPREFVETRTRTEIFFVGFLSSSFRWYGARWWRGRCWDEETE